MPFDGGGSRRDQIVARLEVLRELCSTNMDADQSDWKTCLWSEMRSCPRLPGLPLAEHRKLDCRPFWRIGRYFGLKKRKREWISSARCRRVKSCRESNGRWRALGIPANENRRGREEPRSRRLLLRFSSFGPRAHAPKLLLDETMERARVLLRGDAALIVPRHKPAFHFLNIDPRKRGTQRLELILAQATTTASRQRHRRRQYRPRRRHMLDGAGLRIHLDLKW
jgi:hypothetical protein